MPALLWRNGHRKILFHADGPNTHVAILRSCGELRCVFWLGFISVRGAKAIPGALPVRLEITAYTMGDGFDSDWLAIPPDKNIQGCLVTNNQRVAGAFAVFEDGKPRLVPAWSAQSLPAQSAR
ncbi:MAG: hypothetical protein AAF662_06845 [Pseudomonadota bacterium]